MAHATLPARILAEHRHAGADPVGHAGVAIDSVRRVLPLEGDRLAWAALAGTVGIFVLSSYGLAYSLFPYLVVDRMTLVQAAGDLVALTVILFGAAIVPPVILPYMCTRTAYSTARRAN